MKKGALITIIVLLILIVGAIVFLMYRNNPNLSQQGANNNPSQGTNNIVTGTSTQLNALAANSDTSEPNDAAATTDTNVVDSTGLS